MNSTDIDSLCSEWEDSSQNEDLELEVVTINDLTSESTPQQPEIEDVQVENAPDITVVTSEETPLAGDGDSEQVFYYTVIIQDENDVRVEPDENRVNENTTPKASEEDKLDTLECSALENASDEEEEEPEEPAKKRRKTKKKQRKVNVNVKKRKLEEGANLPSVYSRNQIARHKKRLNELKAREENTDSNSDADSEEGGSVSDRELDINLRIFEDSLKSIDNGVIGEIQCNIYDEKNKQQDDNFKNLSNIFKLSVNKNFEENSVQAEEEEKREDNAMEEIEKSLSPERLSGLSDFSDGDSDFEILISKPIIRKRLSTNVKKEKRTEGKDKITMYDLIHDNSFPFTESDENDFDPDQKEDFKTTEPKKSKNTNKKSKNKNEEIKEEKTIQPPAEKEDKSNLPVPKLKVGADGEIVIDMDSLVIEQTGVSEARNALANSEVIEECGLSYTSYNKKCSYKKQWTPHETLKFYQVLSTIGTDFTLMATLFPGRTRKCMKRKFKREEKANSELIKKALTCKQNFNIHLLEKELRKKEEQVHQFKENSDKKLKIEKKTEKKKAKQTAAANSANKNKKIKFQRKSFFERGVSCFQNE